MWLTAHPCVEGISKIRINGDLLTAVMKMQDVRSNWSYQRLLLIPAYWHISIPISSCLVLFIISIFHYLLTSTVPFAASTIIAFAALLPAPPDIILDYGRIKDELKILPMRAQIANGLFLRTLNCKVITLRYLLINLWILIYYCSGHYYTPKLLPNQQNYIVIVKDKIKLFGVELWLSQ